MNIWEWQHRTIKAAHKRTEIKCKC